MFLLKETALTYSPQMYWPIGKTVNFFCVSPNVRTTTLPDGENDIPGFVNSNGQVDLLYAVNIGESESPVRINFRHALSKVQFQLRREVRSKSMLHVEVTDVDLLGTYSEGTFVYPRATTEENNPTEASTGRWKDQTQILEAKIFQDTATVLTDEYKLFRSEKLQYTLSIPQPLVKSEESNGTYTGAYVRVLCSIYDQNTGLKLWPSATTPGYDKDSQNGYIYFPLNADGAKVTTWEPGKAYNYNLTIGVPKSGSTIDFDITVDMYPEFVDSEI